MIAIACDHGGFLLKTAVIEYLNSAGVGYKDFGTSGAESCDYPDFAYLVTDSIQNKKAELGILICGTGIGMSIAANKARGIRAAVCTDVYMAQMAREHNDANVLCLGARVIDTELALKIVKTFLGIKAPDERQHTARRAKIEKYEKTR